MTVGGEATATATGHGQTVCVTGAGGYIGSWIVKLLLDKGYAVRGTVRNPGTRRQERAPEGSRRRGGVAGALQGRPPRRRRAAPRHRRLPRRLPHRVAGYRRSRGDGGAGGEGHALRDRRGGGVRHGAPRRAHVLHRRRRHGPRPRPGRRRRRVLLERPRLLQEDQELVLLREDGGGAGGVGGGGGARGGPGGGEPGAGAGLGAAAGGERQPHARAQVPRRLRQDVRQRRAGVRARPRHRRRARPRLRVPHHRRPLPLRRRRRRAPPGGRRHRPPQVLPRVPHPQQVFRRGEPEEAAVQDVEPAAPRAGARVHAGGTVPLRHRRQLPGEGHPPDPSGPGAAGHERH